MVRPGTTDQEPPVHRRAHEVLPRSATIIEAFRDLPAPDQRAEVILETASQLADQHQQQWQAEEASRRPSASAEAVAAAKRLIDELNARRIELVERMDVWVAREIHSRADASLHTETLGSVVDRLAIAWVRTHHLTQAGNRDRARLALRQLAELADAYDDLVRDVGNGRRRLPAWRSLKSYRSEP